MTIYGVGVLAVCFLMGQLLGELLGRFLNIEANVGGVGFGMILLILFNEWLTNAIYFRYLLSKEFSFGAPCTSL